MASAGISKEVTCTLLDTGTVLGNGVTHTISGATLGTAAADRQIVVCYGGGNICETGVISSITVGGADLTKIVSQNGSPQTGYRSEIWAAVIATGTSADIVITQTCNSYWPTGIWYHMTGAAVGAEYTATNASIPMNASIDCDANGVIIGSTQCNSGYPM